MFKTGIKILEAKIGIESNREELLPALPLKVEVKSLLTDFREVESIPFSKNLDGYISVEDLSSGPFFELSEGKAKFIGPFLKLTEEASDLRFSLWGNQGFLYRYVLYLLEKKHRIFNLHACALFDEKKNHLYIVIGGAGSGKTVYLLSGLTKNLKLFSTETVHFRFVEGRITWFMGSLVDNVRMGTLMYHFPQFLPKIETQEAGEEWQKKVAIDLSSYKAGQDKLNNPESVTIIFPRIEEGRKGFILNAMKDKRKAGKALFDNISQKLSEGVLLYDRIPLMGLDEEELALTRLNCVNQLVYHETVLEVVSVLTNPHECWEDFLR